MAIAESPSQSSRLKQLEELVEISRVLTSTLDPQKLLQKIVEVATSLTQSETASILLYDAALGELHFEAAPGVLREGLSKVSVPLDTSVAGWIFRHGRPMVVQDAAADPRIYREVDRTLGFQTRSLLGVPLVVKRKAIGVLEAVNKRGRGHYTEDDLAILETLGAQAAIAIENARLLSRLREANEELVRLDRMKSDFIAIASHELRTPLGLILGHATFLNETVPPQYREQMDVIVRSAMRLKTIIEDMATIAHKEKGESRVRRMPFSMSKLVIDTAGKLAEAAANKGIQLGFDVPDAALTVEGDEEKIGLALLNLVRNAITFTDEGGQVGIKAEADEGFVRVLVVDTGIGIPDADKERVFERFYQVESHLTRKHGGMGLGLSIAKAMIELHNGQIWVESKEGMGSLFCFVLPMDESHAQASARVFKTA